MSLIPLLFSDWWEELDRPHRLFDQNFGLGLYPEQLLNPSILDQYILPLRDRRLRSPLMYYRPWGELLRKGGGGGTSTVKADKDKFQVILDVQQFKPEEINVKVVGNSVVVEGKHEEKEDEHGWISRQFTRKYLIPEQCDVDQVTSSLSSDGVLNITAPRKDEPKIQNERTVTIEQTGKPALREAKEKEMKEEEKKQEEEKQEEEKQEEKKQEEKKQEVKKQEEKKQEEKKQEEKKQEEKKQEEKKQEEKKQEEKKQEEKKQEEKKQEVKKQEVKKQEVKKQEVKKQEVKKQEEKKLEEKKEDEKEEK